MRISDWSSDVCSSDLVDGTQHHFAGRDDGIRIRLCRNNSRQFTPQTPGRGEIQIEQGSQGDTLLRCFFPASAEAVQLATLQRFPFTDSVAEHVEEIAQQFDGQATGVIGPRRGNPAYGVVRYPGSAHPRILSLPAALPGVTKGASNPCRCTADGTRMPRPGCAASAPHPVERRRERCNRGAVAGTPGEHTCRRSGARVAAATAPAATSDQRRGGKEGGKTG